MVVSNSRHIDNLSTPFLQAHQHQFASFSPFCKRFEDEGLLIKRMKRIIIMQWIKILWNNSFINTIWLTLLCRNSGATHLAQPGLMEGKLAGWLAEKIWINFEFLKFTIDQNFKFSLHLNKLQRYYSIWMHSS